MHSWCLFQGCTTTSPKHRHDSLISLSRTSVITSTLLSYSKIPEGCASYRVQKIITCLQYCTQSGRPGIVPFCTQERLNHLEETGVIMHLYGHPRRPRCIQGPCAIPPGFCGTGTERSPCLRRTPHSKMKHEEITPLHGGNICGSGDRRPETQHHGRPRL